MKKIRVYSLIRISFAVQALILISGVVISSSGVINLPWIISWIISAINLSSIFIFLGVLTGVISKYDFYKRFDGEIIDEYEVVTLSNVIKNRWIVFFVVQLTFIFLNHLLIEYLALPFVEGWSLGKEHTVPLSFKMILTLSPSIIFVFGSFIWRINKSEEELIRLKRRDRIRTEDLEVLQKNVNLQKWIENDPALQIDKELFSKLVPIDYNNIRLFDDSLKYNKEFILSQPNIDYFMLNFFYSVPYINFEESDLTNELMLKILDKFIIYLGWGDVEFNKSFIKRIMDLYENLKGEDNFTPMPVLKAYYIIINSLRSVDKVRLYPSLASFKECINNKHIIEKEFEQCPYCK
jgi:hypothetical protein